MTEREFWKVLGTTTGWVVVDNVIRRIANTKGFYGDPSVLGVYVCPVCAVANKKSKKTRFALYYTSAAAYLGLDAKFASKVASAADSRRGNLRKKLKKILKLKDA